jgi:hypothetical protein
MKIKLFVLSLITFVIACAFTPKEIHLYKFELTNKSVALTKTTIDSTLAVLNKRLLLAKNKQSKAVFDSKKKQFIVESNEILSDDFINNWLLKQGNITFYECYSIGQISTLSASISTNKKMIEERNKFLEKLNLNPSSYNTLNTAFVGYIKSADTTSIKFFEREAKKYFSKNCMVAFGKTETGKTENFKTLYFLKNDETKFLANNRIQFAKTNVDDRCRPTVAIGFDKHGSDAFATMTEKNVGKCIAIVIDRIVYIAPFVNGKIEGGSLEISGNFTVEETNQLANMFTSGYLPINLTLMK